MPGDTRNHPSAGWRTDRQHSQSSAPRGTLAELISWLKLVNNPRETAGEQLDWRLLMTYETYGTLNSALFLYRAMFNTEVPAHFMDVLQARYGLIPEALRLMDHRVTANYFEAMSLVVRQRTLTRRIIELEREMLPSRVTAAERHILDLGCVGCDHRHLDEIQMILDRATGATCPLPLRPRENILAACHQDVA